MLVQTNQYWVSKSKLLTDGLTHTVQAIKMRLDVSSPIIRAIEDSEYSHIGMFITPGESTDDSMLIESTISRSGVNISTLRAFKERSSGWKITRLHFSDR